MFQFTHPVRGATDANLTVKQYVEFQFTHPVRGATSSSCWMIFKPPTFQFTHPVRGATTAGVYLQALDDVSIHAPRAGCDTAGLYIQLLGYSVSIHAPRAGCDSVILDVVMGYLGFNSRTPCGVRPSEPPWREPS